jgi:hypothetical protein
MGSYEGVNIVGSNNGMGCFNNISHYLLILACDTEIKVKNRMTTKKGENEYSIQPVHVQHPGSNKKTIYS